MTFQKTEHGYSISRIQLKYIALCSMTLDHAGAVFADPETFLYTVLRTIGRLAFPIIAFLLIEGFYHTSDIRAYLLRLFLFAWISEIFFDMAFFHFPLPESIPTCFAHQNIYFTLFTSLLAVCVTEKLRRFYPLFTVFSLLFFIHLGTLLHFDYGSLGVIIVLLFYIFRKFFSEYSKLLASFLVLSPFLLYADAKQLAVFLCVPLFFFYDSNSETGLRRDPSASRNIPGKKDHNLQKYFFYWYYPGHLFVLSLLYFLFRLL